MVCLYKSSVFWSNILTMMLLMADVQGHGYQYFRYAPYHFVRPNTSPACHGNLPCYDIVLTFVADGQFIFDTLTEEKTLLDHFAIFGYDRDAAIAEGRRAVLFFKEKYGFDFSHLSDDDLLTGASMNNEGITFKPSVLDPISGYRLYSGSNNDQSQVFNKPNSFAGWSLAFGNDVQARGTYSGLIPRSAGISFGSYAIMPCQDQASGPCKNVLNPWNPRAPIVLKVKTFIYLLEVQEPIVSRPIDFEVEHPVWGKGIGQGTRVRRNRASNISNVRVIITFPSTR